MRLIDADKLRKKVLKKGFDEPYTALQVSGLISETPAEDAAVVIRCRNCKNYCWDHENESYHWCVRHGWKKETFYCADAIGVKV